MAKHINRVPDDAVSEEEQAVLQNNDRAVKYITFFGDSSVAEDSQVYQEVYESAKILAENGFGVVNGGGPGVMKAATDGAESVGGDTIAVYWQPKLASIFEGKNLSNVTDESEAYSNYMMRTLGLIEKGQVYVCCLGGTGTISEFAMVWALAKLYFGKHKPVILYGEFWPEMIDKIASSMLIDDHELAVLQYATTPEELLKLIKSIAVEVEDRLRKTYQGDETPFVLSPKFSGEYEDELEELKSKYKYLVQNKLTISQLERFCEEVEPPARVLEIGTTSPQDIKYLSEKYAVTSVSENEELMQLAQYENPHADFVKFNPLNYEVQANTFKGIWARDVLHNYKDEQFESLFRNLVRGLVPGGVMQVIVREGEGEGTETETIGGKNVQKYYNYITTSDIQTWADKFGVEIIDLQKHQRSHNWLSVLLRKSHN